MVDCLGTVCVASICSSLPSRLIRYSTLWIRLPAQIGSLAKFPGLGYSFESSLAGGLRGISTRPRSRNNARWPSGKAPHSGCGYRRFESYPGSQKKRQDVVLSFLLAHRLIRTRFDFVPRVLLSEDSEAQPSVILPGQPKRRGLERGLLSLASSLEDSKNPIVTGALATSMCHEKTEGLTQAAILLRPTLS